MNATNSCGVGLDTRVMNEKSVRRAMPENPGAGREIRFGIPFAEQDFCAIETDSNDGARCLARDVLYIGATSNGD